LEPNKVVGSIPHHLGNMAQSLKTEHVLITNSNQKIKAKNSKESYFTANKREIHQKCLHFGSNWDGRLPTDIKQKKENEPLGTNERVY
jgi:hypothetical protein